MHQRSGITPGRHGGDRAGEIKRPRRAPTQAGREKAAEIAIRIPGDLPLALDQGCETGGGYTTNIATPAANMATVVTATITQPRRELGWPCMSFLSAATIRIAARRKGASNPLMTAVQ